jgi:oligopeptide/dipeptide ABC transporter ATP-binding protein
MSVVGDVMVAGGSSMSGPNGAALLEIQDLKVSSHVAGRDVAILRGINLAVAEHARVGIVGESGSGKSMTASSVVRLLPPEVRITSGQIRFAGRDLVHLSEADMRSIRGRDISIVYQNAPASLNPLFTVGEQVATVCQAHTSATRRQAWSKAVEMLEALGIPDAARKARDYPHQFSGGMAQRVAIAMALICAPRLLVADEPTTGLDATIQAQVLDVIDMSADRIGSALLLISHDLAVVQALCDSIVVVYAGVVLEVGSSDEIMSAPLSPYTQGLVSCYVQESDEIAYIPGRVPEAGAIGQGCPFADRCARATDRCRREMPPLTEVRPGHWVACYHP